MRWWSRQCGLGFEGGGVVVRGGFRGDIRGGVWVWRLDEGLEAMAVVGVGEWWVTGGVRTGLMLSSGWSVGSQQCGLGSPALSSPPGDAGEGVCRACVLVFDLI